MNYLKKSIFKNFIEFVKKNNNYNLNSSQVEMNLQDKICNNSIKVNNKMVKKQLNTIIFPAISIYQSLTVEKYDEDEIIDSIKKYVMQYYKKQARIIGILGKVPCSYTIFKMFFPIAMKMYPTEF